MIRSKKCHNSKIAELNLEYESPTVAEALQTMKNSLTTYKKQGYRAVIVIHGYGSSGAGGDIRIAVGRLLCDNSMCGIVRRFVGGEQWHNNKKEILGICSGLKDHERRISGNEGLTVVILR